MVDRSFRDVAGLLKEFSTESYMPHVLANLQSNCKLKTPVKQ